MEKEIEKCLKNTLSEMIKSKEFLLFLKDAIIQVIRENSLLQGDFGCSSESTESSLKPVLSVPQQAQSTFLNR